MDFTLDETQQAIANLAAGILHTDADDHRTRVALDSAEGYDEGVWKSLAQAGLLTLATPEFCGGDGFGAIEVGLVLAEVGRQTLPLPALATLGLGVLPISTGAGRDLQEQLLGGVGDGQVLTAALRDAPHTSATLGGDRLTATHLTAARVGVPYAAQAHRLLVPTDSGTAVLDPSGPGITLQRSPSSTGAPEYTVRAESAPVLAVMDLTSADLDRFAVCAAVAVADGVIAGALDLTAKHLRDREQFGRPLATFQAVAQQVADLYVTARTIHLAAVSCAWRLATGLDADEDLAVAAYWLASQLPQALQVCHHLHGGLGVDITYPLHRYYSHAKDLARFVGGSAHRLELLGDRCN